MTITIGELVDDGAFVWPFTASQRLHRVCLDIWAEQRSWADMRVAEAQFLDMAIKGRDVVAEQAEWHGLVNDNLFE